MLIDLWHHWLLLRLLLVFALAGPLLVFAVLFRGRGQPRGAEGQAHAAPAVRRVATDGHAVGGPVGRVEASPRRWPGGTGGPDRRAA